MRLHPAEGRWPAHEPGDRVALAAGMAALAATGASEAAWTALRQVLVGLATRLAAAPPGPLPGDLADLAPLGVPGPLAVVGWDGPGRARVALELLPSAGGLVPRLTGRPGEAGPFKEVAAAALAIGLAADREEDRLPIALALEGVVLWFSESDRRAAARHALAYALAHADGRLREAGRPGLPRD